MSASSQFQANPSYLGPLDRVSTRRAVLFIQKTCTNIIRQSYPVQGPDRATRWMCEVMDDLKDRKLFAEYSVTWYEGGVWFLHFSMKPNAPWITMTIKYEEL